QGYEVTVLGSGSEALELLDRQRFDLVILDVMLPGVDGIEIARARRCQGDWTSILMLTARDDFKDVIGGIEAGADDYVTKPFDLEALLARVRGLLRRQVWMRSSRNEKASSDVQPAFEGPEKLEFGECRIDFKTLRARSADGSESELSP